MHSDTFFFFFFERIVTLPKEAEIVIALLAIVGFYFLSQFGVGRCQNLNTIMGEYPSGGGYLQWLSQETVSEMSN